MAKLHLGLWGEGGMVYGKRRFGCNWVIKWFYAAAFAAVAVGCGDDTPAG